MADPGSFYHLGDDEAVQRHIRAERERGRKLRKSAWWQTQIQSGKCHFCHTIVGATHLTMDHIVPLARGGLSTKGNVVPACSTCNCRKQLTTPVESILDHLQVQKKTEDL